MPRPVSPGRLGDMDDADAIWNRATEGGGRRPRDGDTALAAALAFHGLAMNGGVLHAFEVLSAQELGGAHDGYAWLGLGEVAAFLQRTAAAIEATDWDDESAVEALEAESDAEYERLLPGDDSDVEAAFRARLAERPEAFAPLRPQKKQR